ncbi:30S ribosomal protein S6e [Candidatus Bathyarchaeota archaeon]|nr:30S ribosomal protein S6e [Candidatus Bathyarchaeota archaeon]
MAKFKIILSDPETGRSQIIELEDSRAVPLIGRRLGETIDGTAIGLGGHKLKITGGSDKDGFPMRPDIHGGVKTRVIITQGVGFHSTRKGERRRRTLRGNVITEEIVQINMKITEKPKKAEKSKKPKKTATKEIAEKTEAVEKKPEEAGKPEKPEKQKKEPKTIKEDTEKPNKTPEET